MSDNGIVGAVICLTNVDGGLLLLGLRMTAPLPVTKLVTAR